MISSSLLGQATVPSPLVFISWVFLIPREISAVDRHRAADGGQAPFQAGQMFRGLLPGAELMVVERIFLPGGGGRQVGHDHVGPRLDPQLPPLGVNGTQCGGGRKKDPGQ